MPARDALSRLIAPFIPRRFRAEPLFAAFAEVAKPDPDDEVNPPVVVDVFRVGHYGDKGSYTEADIDLMVANYDPKIYEAPITVDHVQEGPALGWVRSIERAGKVMRATIKVMPWFRYALKAREFVKPSVEIWTHGMEGTPKPIKGFCLKAITFLGAAAPHVKGLKPATFNEPPVPAGVRFLAFEEAPTPPEVPVVGGASGNPPTTGAASPAPSSQPGGASTPDDGPPPSTPTAEESPAMPNPNLPAPAAPANPPVAPTAPVAPEPDLAAQLAEANRRNAEFAQRETAREARIIALENERASARFSDLFNAAVADGRALPREREHLLAQFNDAVAIDRANPTGLLSFREKPDAAERKLTREQLFAETLKNRPKAVEFGELGSSTGPERGGAPAPATRDERVMQAVREFQEQQAKEGKALTFAEADAMLRSLRPAIFSYE